MNDFAYSGDHNYRKRELTYTDEKMSDFKARRESEKPPKPASAQLTRTGSLTWNVYSKTSFVSKV